MASFENYHFCEGFSIYEPPHFDAQSYTIWKHKFVTFIESIDFRLGSIVNEECSTSYRNFDDLNCQIISYLHRVYLPDDLSYLLNLTTDKDIFDALTVLFEFGDKTGNRNDEHDVLKDHSNKGEATRSKIQIITKNKKKRKKKGKENIALPNAVAPEVAMVEETPGPLSSVWKEWLKWCIEFGIEANAIVAVPYDWRLSASMLEERDLYFHKLKLTFETALKLRGGPSLVFAHSLGNNIFRYFLEWLKLEIAPKHYIRWLDEHIHAYFAVGPPLLGATEAVKATLSGFTFGIPIAEGTARLLYNSFGSSLWLMPFSKYCKADNVYWKNFFEGKGDHQHAHHCDDAEFRSNYSSWPTDVINIEFPSIRGDVCPSMSEVSQDVTSNLECGRPIQMAFSAREVSDGTFFKAIEDFDQDSERLLYHLRKYYQGDPVLNPLTPWDRPPLKNIFCIYGIDMKTEVGYYFAPSGKPYPDNWIITDIVYEHEGTLFSRSGNSVSGNPGVTSGDETVPYHSLSWCKTWLGSKVNITRAPQFEHDGSDLQVKLNVDHIHGEDIIPNMSRSPRVKYITYFEDSESIPGRRTAVWELDKGILLGLQF